MGEDSAFIGPVGVLGMRVAMEDPVLDLQAPDDPAAELIIGAQEIQDPPPSFGVSRFGGDDRFSLYKWQMRNDC